MGNSGKAQLNQLHNTESANNWLRRHWLCTQNFQEHTGTMYNKNNTDSPASNTCPADGQEQRELSKGVLQGHTATLGNELPSQGADSQLGLALYAHLTRGPQTQFYSEV